MKYPDLDFRPSPFSFEEGLVFLHSIKKMAGVEEAEALEHEEEVLTGEEPSPEEAELQAELGEPDTTGRSEGEFLVPLEQVVQTMASLAAVELKLQFAYLFYSEQLRGPERTALSKLFKKFAKDEADDAAYFLRRISVLTGGQGVTMPPVPAPQPTPDTTQILNNLIAGEQQAIVFLKALRHQLGDNPMRYTVEQKLSEEQEHHDTLWQHMPAEMPMGPERREKAAALVALLKRKRASAGDIGGDQSLPTDNLPAVEGAPKPPKAPAPPGPLLAPAAPPAPVGDPVDKLMIQEQAALLQQREAEAAELAAQAQEAREQAAMNAAAAESASAEAQLGQEQSQVAQEQASAATAQAQQAMEQAVMSEENAAAQANAKMNLAIRIQQFRQQLADMAMADPVGEEGLAFGEQAGPGSIVTGQQQAQAQEEEAMAMEAAAANPKAQKEMEQAQKAESEAAQQTQQAHAEISKSAGVRSRLRDLGAKLKGHVQGTVDEQVERASGTIKDKVRKSVEEVGKEKAEQYKKPLAAVAAGAGLLGANSVYQGAATRSSNKKVIESNEKVLKARGGR
jgi:bacterioferritin (cytochrome b1)